MTDSSNESQVQESEEWISTKEAARRLDKSVRYIRTMIHQGKLRAKRRGTVWQVHDSLSGGTEAADGVPSETPGNMRNTVEILKVQLEAKDKQIESLQRQLEAGAEAGERHDTIVLQLTRQIEQTQRLLEYQSDPWYRRMFRKGRKPQGGQNLS